MNVSNISVQIAQFELSVAQSLVGSGSSAASGLSGTNEASSGTGIYETATQGDPDGSQKLEAAFLNRRSLYTEQVSALGQYKASMAQVSDSANALKNLAPDSSAEDIKAALKSFAADYNKFDSQYDPSFDKGGVFENLEATRITKFSLERQVDNNLLGAGKGLPYGGLSNAGFEVSADGQIKFDEAKFDKFAKENLDALRNGVKSFGDNYQQTTEMLLEPGKFIANREARLDEALDFIAAHIDEIQKNAAQSRAVNGPMNAPA